MKKYLLPMKGNFYKANLHCHSTYSDGRKTPDEIKEIYKSLGYSIVAYTDHDILIPHDELTDESFLALHGFESETTEPKLWQSSPRTCHICFIALDPDNLTQPLWHRSKYLFGNAPQYRDQVKFDDSLPDYERIYSGEDISFVMENARKKGFFVTYNHPTWSLEHYDNYMNYNGMNAFEIMNGSCLSIGYNDYNPRVYDDMLMGGKRLYCIGADDNHNSHPLGSRKCDSGVAFTVIKADKLEYSTVTKALVDGNFYASEGPEIYDLYTEDGKVYITCSDADRIAINFDIRRASIAYSEADSCITSASFTIPEDAKYFRLTVTDKSGKHACTNAYFTDEL